MLRQVLKAGKAKSCLFIREMGKNLNALGCKWASKCREGIVLNKNVKIVLQFCALYFFVISLFSIEMLKTQPISIIDRAFPLLFLFFYPAYYFLLFYASKKIKNRTNGKNRYYEKQFPNVNSFKVVNELESVYYFITIFAVGIIVIILRLVNRYNAINKFVSFLQDIQTKEVTAIISVTVGIYAVLFTSLTIMHSYLKNKCLFFDPFDLTIIKRSNWLITLSVFAAIIYFGARAMQKDYWLCGLCAVIWIVLIGLYLFLYIECILITSVKEEREVLKRIDYIFRRKKVYLTPNKKWWRGDVIKKFDKFLKKYKNTLKRIEFNNIESVEFSSTLFDTKENITFAKKKFYFIAVIIVGLLTLLGLGLGASLNEHKEAYLILTLTAALPLLIPVMSAEVIANNYVYINNLGYAFSEWRYYIKLVGKEKRLYITPDCFLFSKYWRYVSALKRIVCFYNLAINMRYEDAEYVDDVFIECMCDYITDLVWDSTYKSGMVVPLLICLCLSENRKEKSREVVKSTLRQVEIGNEEKVLFIDFSLQVLRDLYGDDRKFNQQNFSEELMGLFTCLDDEK